MKNHAKQEMFFEQTVDMKCELIKLHLKKLFALEALAVCVLSLD